VLKDLELVAGPVRGHEDVPVALGRQALDHDLRRAVARALTMDPAACRAHALGYSWEHSVDQLESLLAPIVRRGRV
jgi:hypothetical protein